MPPISNQNRSSLQRPAQRSSRVARERLVEQARATQRRLAARRLGGVRSAA